MPRAMPSPIGIEVALGLDDLVGPRDTALELLVGAQCAELILAAAQQREALKVAAVGRQQDHLEVLDLAVALEPSPVLDALVEYLHRRFSRPRTTWPHPMNSAASAIRFSFRDPSLTSPRPYSPLGEAASHD